MVTASSVIGTWIATCSDAHGNEAYRRAKMAAIDTVACMLSGADAGPTVLVRSVVEKWGTGPCQIVGGGQTSAPWAALVNGTAAHALDFDDNDTPAASHPSAVLLPALIACGEERKRSGRDVLDAYLVGLEVMGRVGEAVNMAHYSRGWHATATIGAIGAAAACARLLRLDRERAAVAVSLATSMAGGLRAQFGTMCKPLHAGLAAKSGVLAANLAEAGLTASERALDGPLGFQAILGGEQSRGFVQLEQNIGQPLAILQYGLSFKRYPCCYYSARCIDAVLELKQEYSFVSADVAEVIANISDRNASIISAQDPKTPDEARFSLRYCLAVALGMGKPMPSHFSAACLSAPAARTLMDLVEIRTYAADPASPDFSPEEPDTVTIHLKSGQAISRTVVHAKGSAGNPLSHDDFLEKLRDCAGDLIDQRAMVILEAALSNFDSLTDLDPFTRLLRIGS